MNTSSRMNADAMSGKCGKGSGIGCFIAGTKVKTIEGDRNIEDIEVGDYVLAENVETGEQEYKEVTQAVTYEKTAIVHVYVGEEEIETTLEHPFYVEGLGFVSAGELQAGDIIRTFDGRSLPIKKIEIEELEETVTVYNFEVEDFHTYYVSELGVLVHNECPVKTETVKPSDGVVTEGGNNPNWEAHNVVNYANYKEVLRTAEAANPLVESLRTTGKLPSNYITKAEAMKSGWKPGKALGNFVDDAQIGGDIFLNKDSIVPNALGREWYEADVGLSNSISRAKQAGTRLLYSNDGLLYITYDHYKTAYSIGKWK